MESLRNCLSLDTEIEPVFLVGSFGVKAEKEYTDGQIGTKLNDDPFTLVKQEETANIKALTSGIYPFFSGKINVNKDIKAEKGTYNIDIGDQFSIFNLYVNDKLVKTFMFERFAEIELNEGINNIRFELIGSLRNTFGPHHHKEDELTIVCPDSFTFKGDWTKTEFPEEYKERYSFIGFGVNKITLTKINKDK